MTFTDDFTCMGWVKLESYAAYGIITRYGGTTGFVFQTSASGQIILQGLGTAGAGRIVTSYASLPLNKWVHVAATMDMSGSAGTVYFDGTLVDSTYANVGAGATALIQSGNLNIGATNGGNFFDGKIAQAAVFSSVLSAATIRSYMSQGLAGSESTLVSAYSFDNAITDLNTTNANNLTAQGSAAATATDSPFANAVAAGLLEYAEINSVSFSTNTTVNVRVPDTCMIPTSGGVSAVSYSTQSNPYGLPYISKVIGFAQICSNFTTTSATDTQVSGLSCPVVVPTGARVKVTFFATNLANGTTTTIGTVSVYNGTPGSGTKLDESLAPMVTGIGNAGTSVHYTHTPISGSITYNAGARTTGGTLTVAGAATTPSYLQVELV